MMALSGSKKTVYIIKRSNIETSWRFLLFECLYSFRTENKLKSHKKVCKNKEICGIVTPREKKKILKFNQYVKSYRMPCIICVDVECLI